MFCIVCLLGDTGCIIYLGESTFSSNSIKCWCSEIRAYVQINSLNPVIWRLTFIFQTYFIKISNELWIVILGVIEKYYLWYKILYLIGCHKLIGNVTIRLCWDRYGFVGGITLLQRSMLRSHICQSQCYSQLLVSLQWTCSQYHVYLLVAMLLTMMKWTEPQNCKPSP